jgi:hypothetical protein
MEPRDVPESRRAQAVSAFDAKYGDQCQVLWCLSRHCRPALLAGQSSLVLEKLISTIRIWWPVRAPAATDQYMAAAITEAIGWSPDVFRPTSAFGSEAVDFAVKLVDKVVASTKELSGSWRREYSWTSKTLHWLLPWRVPAFDKNVRDYLGVPKGWDLERAYGEVARRIFALAREEPPEPAWAGPLEPCTPLRALDKWLWWDGDGKDSPVYVDPDPWRVVRELNLSANDPVTDLLR